MANPSNQVDVRQSLTDFLVQYTNELVLKQDKQNREVSASQLQQSTGQIWGNWQDDFASRVIELFPRRMYDSRAAPSSVPSVNSGGGTGDFTLDVKAANGVVIWLRIVSVSASVGGQIDFYSDVARTKLIYSAAFAGTEHIEATPWTAIADDATDLEARTLYGTITNNGGTNSVYTTQLVLEGI